MAKIKNILLKNKTVAVSTEVVKFDENGIGEISSDTIYQQVLELKNFSKVEDEDTDKKQNQTPKEVSKGENSDTKIVDENKNEEIPVEDDTQKDAKDEALAEKKASSARKSIKK